VNWAVTGIFALWFQNGCDGIITGILTLPPKWVWLFSFLFLDIHFVLYKAMSNNHKRGLGPGCFDFTTAHLVRLHAAIAYQLLQWNISATPNLRNTE
jgi:hypothetical protein